MTSYITITDAETDPEAPLTSELAKKWRDNPIAIGEADSTVPANLLPTVLLGTLNLSSGSVVTLSGLTLTNYRMLFMSFKDVDPSAFSNLGTVSINGVDVLVDNVPRCFQVWVDLANSVLTSSAIDYNNVASTLTNASTSVSVSTDSTFQGGTARIYGVK